MIKMTKSLHRSALSEGDSDRDNRFTRISSVYCNLWDIKSEFKEIICVDDVDDVDDVDVTDMLKGEALKALLRTISIRKDESVLFN